MADGKQIGSTTLGAGGGGAAGAGLGAALADVLVRLVPALDGLQTSITVIISAVIAFGGALLLGKLIPTNKGERIIQNDEIMEEFKAWFSILAAGQSTEPTPLGVDAPSPVSAEELSAEEHYGEQ